MSDRPNALQMPLPPGGEDNPLMGGATPADAWDANRQAYGDWLARDRQRQIELGHVDPQTGQLTPAGWRAQAQTIAGGFGPADVGMIGGMAGLIKNYHGSPHLFPPTPKNPLGEFRLDKIGTGEGSQVFGQGMYTADVPTTSETYKNLNLGNVPLFKGQKIGRGDEGYDVASWMNAPMKAGETMEDYLWRRADQVEEHGKFLRRGTSRQDQEASGMYFDAAAKLKAQNPADWSFPQGHMYEVNIHAEPHEFLHWDKPISEQNPQVQDMARRVGIDPRDFDIVKGAALYRKAGDYFGPSSKDPSFDMAATNGLREAGIPGIRYLDRGSRGGDPDAPGATHNHVVFDPEKMEIIRRFGLAGLMAGGAAATAAGGQDQGSQ